MDPKAVIVLKPNSSEKGEERNFNLPDGNVFAGLVTGEVKNIFFLKDGARERSPSSRLRWKNQGKS